ncbi:hypothetical protein PM082_007554 [Marasmius tenuissimus]|nr:hypothetical protein PM082_007554 [Marasmius tenuissimus]
MARIGRVGGANSVIDRKSTTHAVENVESNTPRLAKFCSCLEKLPTASFHEDPHTMRSPSVHTRKRRTRTTDRTPWCRRQTNKTITVTSARSILIGNILWSANGQCDDSRTTTAPTQSSTYKRQHWSFNWTLLIPRPSPRLEIHRRCSFCSPCLVRRTFAMKYPAASRSHILPNLTSNHASERAQ